MRSGWSRSEVEAVVTDYFAMLTKELRREEYNKTTHRRALARLLDGRSDGSIERKHQNISAILIELGYPYIFGYKPLGNYQTLLYEVVADRVSGGSTLTTVVSNAVDEPAVVPGVDDILARLEDPPEPAEVRYPPLRERGGHPAVHRPPVNYLEREARNSSLGRAGEEFVLNFERARLLRLGHDRLAERVEHVSLTEGDRAGFDVRSFERNGADRLIEVKTTAYGKQTPFFVSRNEVAVSRVHDAHYHLYRLFRFREDPRLYAVNGALDRVCRLDPVQFAGLPK